MQLAKLTLPLFILLSLTSCVEGLIAGSLAGGLAGAALGRESNKVGAGAVLGVAAGAALGSAIGAAIEEQRRIDEEPDPMLIRQDVEKRRQARDIEDLQRQVFHDNALRRYLRDRRDPDYEEVYGDTSDY